MTSCVFSVFYLAQWQVPLCTGSRTNRCVQERYEATSQFGV